MAIMAPRNDWRAKRDEQYDGHNRPAGAAAARRAEHARRQRRIVHRALMALVASGDPSRMVKF